MSANRSLPKGFGAVLAAVVTFACASPTPAAPIAQKLETIIVPKVELNGVSLETAIEYLNIRSADLKGAPGTAAQKGINFILKDPDGSLSEKKVTLQLTKVPLKVVLNYITRGARATYRLDSNAIIIARPQFLSGGSSVIPNPPGAAKPVLDRLRTTVLPKFSVQNTTLEEAVQVLRALTSSPGKEAPLNFVIRHPRIEVEKKKEEGTKNAAEVEANIIVKEEEKEIPEQRFTLQLNNVQLGTALMYVCELSGVYFTAHPNAVMIGNIEDIISRPADPGSHAYGRSGVKPGGTDLATKLRGLIIPKVDLDSVTLDQALDFVRVEARNADTKSGNPTPTGINIVNMAKEEDDSQKLSLTLYNIPAWDLLAYITKLTETEFRVEPSAVVVDWKLPRRGVADAKPPENPLRLPQNQQFGGNFPIPVLPSTPQGFTTRNVGTSMTVSPVLGSDGRTIDLGISFEHSEFEGFIDYGNGVKVPVFNTTRVTRR